MLTTDYGIYFENAAVRVLEHPCGFAAFQYKPGPRTLADLQAALIHVDNLLRQHRWWKVLNDQRRMAPFSAEETAWVRDYWRAHIAQHPRGIYAAVLLAQDVFARLAAGQLRHDHRTAAPGISYRQFEGEAEAVAWLKLLR